MKSFLSLIALVAVVLGMPQSARAQSDKLVADFQAKSGTKVAITYGTGVGTRKTVASGGALDATLLFAPFDDALKAGNVVAGSATVVARLRLAIAVPKGAPRP